MNIIHYSIRSFFTNEYYSIIRFASKRLFVATLLSQPQAFRAGSMFAAPCPSCYEPLYPRPVFIIIILHCVPSLLSERIIQSECWAPECTYLYSFGNRLEHFYWNYLDILYLDNVRLSFLDSNKIDTFCNYHLNSKLFTQYNIFLKCNNNSYSNI